MLHPAKCANQQNRVFIVVERDIRCIYFVSDTEDAYYACIISEEENAELEKALKVSAFVVL